MDESLGPDAAAASRLKERQALRPRRRKIIARRPSRNWAVPSGKAIVLESH
jgi:hypothetical protein